MSGLDGFLEPGYLIAGRWRVRSVLGQGGMGIVYCAEDARRPGAQVAVKQMQLSAKEPADRASAIRQFQHEAEILRNLRHTNLPRVYACFEEKRQYFLVMDFIEGRTLSQYVDLSGARPPQYLPSLTQVYDWGIQIARVLAYLHNQRPNPVVYKDLKPDNLMLRKDGLVMFLDFGIAKSLSPGGRYSTILKGVGSPGFAAPEQYARQQSDPRADLYALGATLYALTGGQIPIDAVDRQQAVIEGRPDPLEPLLSLAPDTPRALDAVIRRLMAVRKPERYQRAEDAVRALEDARDGREERGGLVSRMFARVLSRGPASGPRTPLEPLEIIVSGEGVGDFVSINEAIRQATDGSLVRVMPGRYEETLVLDRDVEVVGDGHVNDVVVEAVEGSTVLMLGPKAGVRGLTLLSREDATASTVDVKRGSLTLEDCHIRQSALAGVHVHGRDAFAIIRTCRVEEAAEAGILVNNEASATIEDCDVVRNQFAGIEIAEHSDAEVRRCTIREAGGAGIYVHDEARATFEDCDVSGSSSAGVTVLHGADPLFRRCDIHSGKSRGVVVGTRSMGVFEQCQIVGHPEEGVLIYDGANPEIRECTIAEAGKSGIIAQGASYGLVEDSEINANAEAGVLIAEGADPILRRCNITGNRVGVIALATARGTIEYCTVRQNQRASFEFDARSQIKERQNES